MKYYLLNVFTKNFKNGNQLAAVFPERNLSGEEMQQITREFNFSETIFFTPGNYTSIKIYTPNRELPFAGHPLVGAAWLLRYLAFQERNFTLEVQQGAIEVDVGEDTFITFPGNPLVKKYEGDLEGLLRESNLDFTDTDLEQIRTVNVGPEFTIIPLNSRAALSQATPPVNFHEKHTKAYYIFKVSDDEYAVRMFAPGISVTEDAATGSAACALGGYLREVLGLPQGKLTITQGTEMRRECELKLLWDKKIQVGGKIKLWGEGELLNL